MPKHEWQPKGPVDRRDHPLERRRHFETQRGLVPERSEAEGPETTDETTAPHGQAVDEAANRRVESTDHDDHGADDDSRGTSGRP